MNVPGCAMGASTHHSYPGLLTGVRRTGSSVARPWVSGAISLGRPHGPLWRGSTNGRLFKPLWHAVRITGHGACQASSSNGWHLVLHQCSLGFVGWPWWASFAALYYSDSSVCELGGPVSALMPLFMCFRLPRLRPTRAMPSYVSSAWKFLNRRLLNQWRWAVWQPTLNPWLRRHRCC